MYKYNLIKYMMHTSRTECLSADESALSIIRSISDNAEGSPICANILRICDNVKAYWSYSYRIVITGSCNKVSRNDRLVKLKTGAKTRKVSKYSRTSTTRTSLGPCKFVLDMGSSSH